MLNKAVIATLATLLAGLSTANLALADPRGPHMRQGNGQGPGDDAGAPPQQGNADAAKAKAKAEADAAAAKAKADADARRAAAAAKANADAAAAKAKADAEARRAAAGAKANADAAAAKAKADADARRAAADAKANADAAAAKAKADADARRAAANAKANADAAAAKARADAEARRAEAGAKANADAAAAKAKADADAKARANATVNPGNKPVNGTDTAGSQAGTHRGNGHNPNNFGAKREDRQNDTGASDSKAAVKAKADADAKAEAEAKAKDAKAKADADAARKASDDANASRQGTAGDKSRNGVPTPNPLARSPNNGSSGPAGAGNGSPVFNSGAPGSNNWNAGQPAGAADDAAKRASPDAAKNGQKDGQPRGPVPDTARNSETIGPDNLFGRKRYQALPTDQARAGDALREEKKRNDQAFEKARDEARAAAGNGNGNAPGAANANRNVSRFDDKAAARFDDVRRNRRERVTESGVGIFEEPDNRTIVRNGDRAYIRHDESARFTRSNREVRRERRADGTTLVVALGLLAGVEILSVLDDNGHLIRRSRRDRDGREIMLIDNSDYYHRHRHRDYNDAFVELPPPRVRIPENRYIVEYDSASDDDLYEALSAPPVERLTRGYSLEEVRQSYSLRERMRRVDLDAINFAFASWDVDPDQYNKLERIANAMKRIIDRNPDEMFMIEGHTDAVGSDLDNLSLSDRRAESVAIILSDTFRVPPENMTTQGYGEEFLKIPTDGPERENRRVAVRRITPLLSHRTSQRDDDR